MYSMLTNSFVKLNCFRSNGAETEFFGTAFNTKCCIIHRKVYEHILRPGKTTDHHQNYVLNYRRDPITVWNFNTFLQCDIHKRNKQETKTTNQNRTTKYFGDFPILLFL